MKNIRNRNVLLRRPCLMEDEGNYHPVCVFDNFDELSKWIEDNDCVTGYFGPGDFVYTGTGGSGVNKYGIRNLCDVFTPPQKKDVQRDPRGTEGDLVSEDPDSSDVD